MTTSADSGQIAKARRFWSEWCGTNGIEAAEGWLELTPEQARQFAAAFAASERQAVKEECAKVADEVARKHRVLGDKLSENDHNLLANKAIMCAQEADKIAKAIRSSETGKEGETNDK